MKPVIFDVDGCLADFVFGFTTIGREMFGIKRVSTFEHPSWNHLGGLNPAQRKAVWARVHASETFWYELPPLVAPATFSAIRYLMRKTDVYFVTNRAGARAKGQTVAWLEANLHEPATVVLSKYKGEMAKAIQAGYAIEDKASNASCIAWLTEDRTRSYLLDQPANRCDDSFLASTVVRVPSVDAYLNAIFEGK